MFGDYIVGLMWVCGCVCGSSWADTATHQGMQIAPPTLPYYIFVFSCVLFFVLCGEIILMRLNFFIWWHPCVFRVQQGPQDTRKHNCFIRICVSLTLNLCFVHICVYFWPQPLQNASNTMRASFLRTHLDILDSSAYIQTHLNISPTAVHIHPLVLIQNVVQSLKIRTCTNVTPVTHLQTQTSKFEIYSADNLLFRHCQRKGRLKHLPAHIS